MGSRAIPEDALYGIHSLRAKENFPDRSLFHPDWYRAIAKVKLACYVSYSKFKAAVLRKYPHLSAHLKLISEDELNALMAAAGEASEGKHFEHFIVPAIQGGAGTSINLNVNEIIANRALQVLGSKPGDYERIDPIEKANIYQSTNDVIPTALVVASMEKLQLLEEVINQTRSETEKLETRYRNTLRLAYTQMQEAVPSTWGMLFSSYSDALSRDWWRVSKAFERIKQVNLGGGATGTGLSIPRYFLLRVVPELKRLTGLPVTQAENLADATSNQDKWVEVHAILKAHAVNLEKMVSDIRLLSSGLLFPAILRIPTVQTGSSIMPGKVNPVIPEFVISSAHEIYSNDQLITRLAAMGTLELNACLPSLGHAVLRSLDLLTAMNSGLKEKLFAGIEIDEPLSREKLFRSPSVTTALTPYIGYNRAAELAGLMKEKDLDVFEANRCLKSLDHAQLEDILSPSRLIKKGFTMEDIENAIRNKKSSP
jgi:aspartate ammonia-lyase